MSFTECFSNVVYDKYYANIGIRMVARGTGIYHGKSVSHRAGASYIPLSSHARNVNYTDIILIKYIDDVPIDLPLDDPVMAMTRYAHSDELKKYLGVD